MTFCPIPRDPGVGAKEFLAAACKMSVSNSHTKGLGSRRGEIGPAIEMHTDSKYVYMVYFIEKNRNFICLVLKLWKLWVSKDKDPLLILRKK